MNKKNLLILIIFSLIIYRNETFAQPSINTVTGDISTTFTINGSGFTEKINAKPLFWWKADFGTSPSALGRITAWKGDDNLGMLSTAIVAPGSQQSFGTDHGTSSGVGLSGVDFNSAQLYLHRKTYEDFDITTDESIRTTVILISGTLNVGDIVTGQTSGATGKIIQIKSIISTPTDTDYNIRYDNFTGTLGMTPPIQFIKGEEQRSNSGAVMTNTERLGILESFNFKTLRFWGVKDGRRQNNNMHISAQGTNGSEFRITPEGTGPTTWPGAFTIQKLNQLPREWKVEEFQYQTSDINVTNGIFNFYQKGILGTDNKFRNRTTEHPNRYGTIYQAQVSHNAQPGSVMYYDALYLDDTWHRVVVSEGSTWATRENVEIQIPAEWNDNQIVINTNLGGLNLAETPLYLYVVDKEGVANENGFPLQSVLDTTDPISNISLLLYPNPTAGNATLEIPQVEKGWTYQIIALTGQIVQLGTINESTSNLNLKGLNNGVYFIKLSSEQKTETIGVIKQ